jgi:hypothetical protein
MKTVMAILALIFTLSAPAYAGSANCTNARTITEGATNVPLTGDDCILEINIPLESMAAFTGNLPTSASPGDEFTLKNLSPYLNESGSYFDEETQEWVYYSVNYTGAIGLNAEYPEESSSDGWYTNTPGYFIKAVYDGTHWQFSSDLL